MSFKFYTLYLRFTIDANDEASAKMWHRSLLSKLQWLDCGESWVTERFPRYKKMTDTNSCLSNCRTLCSGNINTKEKMGEGRIDLFKMWVWKRTLKILRITRQRNKPLVKKNWRNQYDWTFCEKDVYWNILTENILFGKIRDKSGKGRSPIRVRTDLVIEAVVKTQVRKELPSVLDIVCSLDDVLSNQEVLS